MRSDFIYDKATGTVAQQNISANRIFSTGNFLMLRLHDLALGLKLKNINQENKKRRKYPKADCNLTCLLEFVCIDLTAYILSTYCSSSSDIALLSIEMQRKLGKSIYMQVTSSVCYWRHCTC